jgi:hypothetical protein
MDIFPNLMYGYRYLTVPFLNTQIFYAQWFTKTQQIVWQKCFNTKEDFKRLFFKFNNDSKSTTHFSIDIKYWYMQFPAAYHASSNVDKSNAKWLLYSYGFYHFCWKINCVYINRTSWEIYIYTQYADKTVCY